MKPVAKIVITTEHGIAVYYCDHGKINIPYLKFGNAMEDAEVYIVRRKYSVFENFTVNLTNERI